MPGTPEKKATTLEATAPLFLCSALLCTNPHGRRSGQSQARGRRDPGGEPRPAARSGLMAGPGADEHQKRRRGRLSPADLLLNCDLPPPAKLFGPLPTLLHRLESAAGTDKKGDGGNEDLRRALRLSQSRAREAEQKLAAANGGLAALLVRDSVLLSTHRRWVMMLEAENSALRAAGAEPEDDEGDGPRHAVAAAWWVALAVCVFGLALGNLLL